MTRNVLIAVVAFVATFSFSITQADAQKTYRPVKQLNRWLGHWHNHGYHHRTPGPDVSYYNPYSAHNSHRVAQFSTNGYAGRPGIGFQQRLGNGFQQPLNQTYPNSYIQQPFNPNMPVQEGSGIRNFEDIPEPNARSVESNIEGEVESINDGRINNSVSPGDDSSYDSYWDEDKTSSLLRTNGSPTPTYRSSFRTGGSQR